MKFIKKHQKTSLIITWILWTMFSLVPLSSVFGIALGGLVYYGLGFILFICVVFKFWLDLQEGKGRYGYDLGYKDGKAGIPRPNDYQIVRKVYSKGNPEEHAILVSNYHKGYDEGWVKTHSARR